MIISVSRRTDIPAFYSNWFFNRLEEGFVFVRNPMNFNQVSKILLDKKFVECFVFWTKDPTKMLNRLDLLKGFHYYFQFTLNSYDKDLEVNVPGKTELINSFIELSNKIGKERVIWRYDPIIITDKYSIDYHLQKFDYLANHLYRYTNKCIFSYLNLYVKTQRNLKNVSIHYLNSIDKRIIAKGLSSITEKFGIQLETCSESIELSDYNIKRSKCIDDTLISKIIGADIKIEKDKHQREECGCSKSIDIGAYNTCGHNCKYCYANFNMDIVIKNMKEHKEYSPILFGELRGNERITERNMVSYVKNQMKLF